MPQAMNHIENERRCSLNKVKQQWQAIIHKYSALPPDKQGDIVDLRTGKVVSDSGHLRSMKDSTRQRDNVWRSLFLAEMQERQQKAAREEANSNMAYSSRNKNCVVIGNDGSHTVRVPRKRRRRRRRKRNLISVKAERNQDDSDSSVLFDTVSRNSERREDGMVDSIPILTDSEEEAKEERYYDELLLEDPDYFKSTRTSRITTRSKVSEHDNLTVSPAGMTNSRIYYEGKLPTGEGTRTKKMKRPSISPTSDITNDPLAFKHSPYNFSRTYKFNSASMFQSRPENYVGPIFTASKMRRLKRALKRSNLRAGNVRLKKLIWKYYKRRDKASNHHE